jgi:hypothetical protein
MIKGLKGRKVNHAIDPHKEMGLQQEPGAHLNLIFKSKNCCSQIIRGHDVQIYIEGRYETRRVTFYEMLYHKTLFVSDLEIYLCLKDRSSFKLRRYNTKDIQGFIFGGSSSRFWFAKNCINLHQQGRRDLDPELICWNMISLTVKVSAAYSKTINLIIPNEREMDTMLQFLLETCYKN